MDLAARFGSFSLDEDLSCVQCGKGVEKGRSYSMDEVRAKRETIRVVALLANTYTLLLIFSLDD